MIRMLWDSFLHVSNREAEKCDINEVEDKMNTEELIESACSLFWEPYDD